MEDASHCEVSVKHGLPARRNPARVTLPLLPGQQLIPQSLGKGARRILRGNTPGLPRRVPADNGQVPRPSRRDNGCAATQSLGRNDVRTLMARRATQHGCAVVEARQEGIVYIAHKSNRGADQLRSHVSQSFKSRSF